MRPSDPNDAPPASCEGCLAWGSVYCTGLCTACYQFASRYRAAISECGACQRIQPLRTGYCRLCWHQARENRPTGPGSMMAPYLRQVGDLQLFFAGMTRRRAVAAPKTTPPRHGRKGQRLSPPPPAASRPHSTWVQQVLFQAPRDYRYGRYDLRKHPTPDNPWLAWALHIAHTRAESRGWEDGVRRAVNRTLVMLLSDFAEGDTIRSSDFYAVLRQRGDSRAHTAEILQTMDILLDDLPSTFNQWLQAKLDGLSPGMRRETEKWTRTLCDGGPRSRARQHSTAQIYLRTVRPALLEWSARYDHLREVTREDILGYLNSTHGAERQHRLAALRSLFTWAKTNGIVFRNPTSRIKTGKIEPAILQPLTSEQIAQTVNAATSPQARLFIAMAGVHAARPGAIRALHLTDIDLGNRSLTIAGRTRPMDDLTHHALLNWLDHRKQRWPNTTNPHLLISTTTALGTGEVSHTWLHPILRGLPATLERLRIDRQLEEALVHGPDPLHLANVFGLDPSTAIRYTNSARQILRRPHEATASSSPTRESFADEGRAPPAGSG